jgi:hypothetical protein
MPADAAGGCAIIRERRLALFCRSGNESLGVLYVARRVVRLVLSGGGDVGV